MKIFTSYYAQFKKLTLDENNILISISSSIPTYLDKTKFIWLKELAPSWNTLNEYKTIPNEEKYILSYNKEQDKNDLKILFDDLNLKYPNKNLIIMCYEKPTDFCHRQIVAEKLETIYQINIKELYFENMKRENYKMVLKDEISTILEFKNEYSFLSNMALNVNFEKNGFLYPSVEHYYVAMKLNPNLIIENKTIFEYISNIASPYEAKKIGQTLKLNQEWSNEYRLKIMKEALEYKFSLPYFKEKLKQTGQAILIEGNYWGDKFWGVSLKDNQGENNLGKLIMKIRETIQ